MAKQMFLLCQRIGCAFRSLYSGLCLERKAVGALNDSGVGLMCADLNLVERAVVIAAAMMLAVVNSAADMMVSKFSTHNQFPFADRRAAGSFLLLLRQGSSERRLFLLAEF